MYAPILAKYLKDLEGEEVKRKDVIPLTDFTECNLSWSCAEETNPLFWVQTIENTLKGKSTYYELRYNFHNGTSMSVAQVVPLSDSETKEPTGSWQAQFTCKVNRKITPVKTLAANIIQISWIFGMPCDTVFEQLKPFGIFKTI